MSSDQQLYSFLFIAAFNDHGWSRVLNATCHDMMLFGCSHALRVCLDTKNVYIMSLVGYDTSKNSTAEVSLPVKNKPSGEKFIKIIVSIFINNNTRVLQHHYSC